jgi:hypothetical protein
MPEIVTQPPSFHASRYYTLDRRDFHGHAVASQLFFDCGPVNRTQVNLLSSYFGNINVRASIYGKDVER